MTEQVGKRSATSRRRWQSAVAGGCAGVLLWAAAPAAAETPATADTAAHPPAADTGDRDTLLRLLAEEMTTRLVAALSIQARSHAAEVTTLEHRLRTTEERLEQAETARQRADATHRDELKDMRELLARAEAAMGGIGASQAAMKAALAERDGDVARLKTELAGALAAAAEAREQAGSKVATARPDPVVMAELQDLRGRLDETTAVLERTRQETAAVATERDRLRQEAEDAAVTLVTMRIDRDLIEGERDALADRIETVAAQATVPAAPADAPAMASEAIERLGQIEQFLSSTGINVQRFSAPVVARGTVVPPPLPAARQGARGGPFIPPRVAAAAGPSPATEAAVRVDQQHLERLERIERVLRVLPLGAPLQHYSFESGFGRRSDPFKRRAAMHEGVDLAAPMRTQLRVTAPGTVVHAGPKSAYGRTVDVKHANGLVTRYAHMSEIKVAEGARLDRGDVIGLLGSSGRSTGPHVHYEVIVDGNPVDPVRFIGRRK